MIPYKGKKAKIVIKGDDGYYLDIDNMEWLWEDSILEDVECIPLSNEEIVEDFLEKVDIDYEEYEKHNIGDISYNAIKKLLSDVIYLKEENEKLREKTNINIAYAEYLEKILNEYKKESILKQKVKNMRKEKEWALENYDCDKSDYKQSQAIGAWNILQKLLKESEK